MAKKYKKQKWTFKRLYKNGKWPKFTYSFNLYAHWNSLMYKLYYTFQVSRETKEKEALAKIAKEAKRKFEQQNQHANKN